jgi:hypothetical protein
MEYICGGRHGCTTASFPQRRDASHGGKERGEKGGRKVLRWRLIDRPHLAVTRARVYCGGLVGLLERWAGGLPGWCGVVR